mmetsp:Transcript_6179/g.8777  ORF Transcript_6179/g.8777 Transcript_6179/m.8777 type:complete len:268 (-) Transcript_6179:132-935(-)|eukprot:scaffold2812_cov255-Skeletonema_marinoi.AAC.9
MTITTIIFDVDDCLYDVGTGFTAHRNTDGATEFMVDNLHFPSKEAAQQLRDEYFLKYHSTAKALVAAEEDGRLPPLPNGVSLQPGEKRFDPNELDKYWATNLDFSMLGGSLDQRSLDTFESLSRSSTQIVGFSNGPRLYVERVLKEIGLAQYFEPNKLFGVTDVLPHCKPDKSSFEFVLNKVGALPEQCIMVEDSMKNIRAAKSLGMKTILIMGKGRKQQALNKGASLAEATKVGDAPDDKDQAVDAAVETVAEIDTILKEWMVLSA